LERKIEVFNQWWFQPVVSEAERMELDLARQTSVRRLNSFFQRGHLRVCRIAQDVVQAVHISFHFLDRASQSHELIDRA